MSQVLQQARPGRGRARMSPAIRGIEGAVPLNPRFTTAGTRPLYRGRGRLAGWRARNWRRVVLAWFALSMIIMVMAAEPKSDFPKEQVRSVPAVQTFLRVAGGLTVAGVPVLLIALP